MRYDIREDRAYACDDAVLRKAHVLARDVAGNIWVGTWGAGVVRLVNPLAQPIACPLAYHLVYHETALLAPANRCFRDWLLGQRPAVAEERA